MNIHKEIVLAVLFAVFSLVFGMAAASADEATYSITVEANWTPGTHALDYPADAHFSGLIGAAHGADYAIFRAGTKATPGLKNLSEAGQHSPLDAEIGAAIAAGTAGSLFETAPLFDFPGTLTATVTVTDRFPLVSIAAMIAPSPDWFAGISSGNLRDGGGWVPAKVVTLYAWDAGTDDGTTYKAENRESAPHQPVAMNDAPHFMKAGKRIPVGKVTFTRVAGPATN